MELIVYDAAGKRQEAETLLNLQPELWEPTETLVAAARMTPRFEDLPASTLEACLREGMSEMARHVHVYGRGLVAVEDGVGVVFGARTTLECEEAGADAAVGVEHVIVFDAESSRIQHDRSLWIDVVPMDAIATLDGQDVRAAWLVTDGVWVGGAGEQPSRAVKFTDPWKAGELPVHFFEPMPGSDRLFALGVVERPMATVGQGESYLVMHMAHRDDPARLEVSRLALPDHPQAAAAAWSGDRLGVMLFSEVRPPHAESQAHVRFVTYATGGEPSGELETVLEWDSATGKTYGMLELQMAWTGGTYAGALLHEQDMVWLVELITVREGQSGRTATHDVGWREAKDLRLVPDQDGFLMLWSDKVIRLLEVAPPFGEPAPQ
jgi:hypothetical protein